ncbi:hypothetical protein Csal_2367 [Chromohalobacter israelensis DSM 3043]|uniref:Uncharacterized protein n=1 Tax=Chromohalobacter israelensis (strain ATCC BAA-138 / DSM 3043 / CIP 106854 / NCIMB 13768 / 1H11) TaxID=290398 RepID=Q1QUZ2_CHRI1|nr:hypothetical protein Csal_2367 [Chromohalobacter salexigens DSM 3043]
MLCFWVEARSAEVQATQWCQQQLFILHWLIQALCLCLCKVDTQLADTQYHPFFDRHPYLEDLLCLRQCLHRQYNFFLTLGSCLLLKLVGLYNAWAQPLVWSGSEKPVD